MPILRREAELAVNRTPTWEEMQIVLRPASGIRTVSTVRPSSELEKVSPRTIGGVKPRIGFRQSDGELFGQLSRNVAGKGGNFVEILDFLLVQG